MKPAINALRAYYFAYFMMVGAYVPFLPGWLRANGIRGFEMGLIMALTYATSVVAPPIVGVLADALGLHRWLLRVACAGSVLCFGALALVVSAGPMPSFAFVFTVILVSAFFRPSLNMLADVAALEHGHSYGRIRMWGSLGFIATAGTLGGLIDTTAPAPLIIVITLSLVIALGCTFLFPPSSKRPPAPVWAEASTLLRQPYFRWFLVASFLSQVAHIAYDLCLSLHVRDLGGSDAVAGGFWALGAVAEILLMAQAARFFARETPAYWFWISLAIGAARWVIFATVGSLVVLAVLQVLHAFTFGLRWVSSLEIVRTSAGPNTLATAQGAFLAANAVGGVTGLLLWGSLYESAGGTPVFAGAAVFGAASAVTAYLAARPSAQPLHPANVS